MEIKGQYEIPRSGTREESLTKLKKLIRRLTPKGVAPLSATTRFLPTFADVGLYWGATVQSYFAANSIFWLHPSTEAIAIYREAVEMAPGKLDGVEFNAMRGQVATIPSGATAFPWRAARYWSQHVGKTLDPADLPLHQAWVEKLYARLRESILPQEETGRKRKIVIPAYANCPQSALTSEKRFLPAYYGHNVDRLLAVKRKYDPHDHFHYPQSIPVVSPGYG